MRRIPTLLLNTCCQSALLYNNSSSVRRLNACSVHFESAYGVTPPRFGCGIALDWLGLHVSKKSMLSPSLTLQDQTCAEINDVRDLHLFAQQHHTTVRSFLYHPTAPPKEMSADPSYSSPLDNSVTPRHLRVVRRSLKLYIRSLWRI